MAFLRGHAARTTIDLEAKMGDYKLFRPRDRENNFILCVAMTTAKMLFFVVLLIGVAGLGLGVGVGKAWVDTSPALDLEALHSQSQTSFIYDKYGELITEYKGSENRIYVSLDEVPENLIDAIVATEDARFWEHNGVDIKRIGGAFISTFFRGNTQGGSTITCQLIKLTLLTSDQNFRRKVQEAYLALQLEDTLSKEEILEEYINIIYLGGSSYGVKIAAQDYFGKDLSELTLRECATIAGMIRNPSSYNPRRNYYTRNTPEVTDERTDYVLRNMHEQGYITDEEYQQALNDTLTVLEESGSTSSGMYDHAYYVEYALYDVVTKMLRVEGDLEDNSTNRAAMQRKLRTGGYRVYASLDPEVQQAAQDVITNWDNYPDMQHSNDSTTRSSLGGGEYLTVVQPQAAAAVINYRTGELVAIVGGREEPVQMLQFNRAYQNNMPVGSSIKPLSVYAPAFDLGHSPGTPVLNLPIPILNWQGGEGYPNNYGGGDFTGSESMRTAMNRSHNTAAAQALMTYVGIENSVAYLLRLGVDPDHINANGAGLALGSSGLSVIELAAGFGTLGNLGEYLEPYAFTRIENSDGSIYIDISQVQIRRQVFKQSTAWMTVDVLKGCVASGVGTGSSANFRGMEVAGKTGTHSENRCVTFAGMTGYYSAAVWIGSDEFARLESNATGGRYAAPLWAALMERVHSVTRCTTNTPILTKSAAAVGLVQASCCGVSGMRPTSACQNDVNGYGINTDYYLAGTEPDTDCNMHRALTFCRRSRLLATSACSSTTVRGVIYIPAGHPLRMADDEEVLHQYFYGASSSEESPGVGYCNQCG